MTGICEYEYCYCVHVHSHLNSNLQRFFLCASLCVFQFPNIILPPFQMKHVEDYFGLAWSCPRRSRPPLSCILIPHIHALNTPSPPSNAHAYAANAANMNTGSLKLLPEAKGRLSVFINLSPVALFCSWCQIVYCCVHSLIDFTSILRVYPNSAVL
jgi:hypothetical protein